MRKAEVLLKESIHSQLCCHCGVCAGVCPTQAIEMNNNVLSVNIERCIDCNLCVTCCPAGGYELSDLTMEDIKDIPTYSVASQSEKISNEASSGGFVTQALLTLLANGKITEAAVVVTGNSLDESCAKYVMTNDPDMILKARRSKYTQATVNGIIQYIKKNDGRYAVVGLPCQLYGITQVMRKIPVLRERIIYKLGMVCGYTYDEECVQGLLKVMGVEKKEVRQILGWREGGLPGSFSVEMKDGKVCSLPFADEHSVDVTYYAQNRCRLCRDCLCECGDVVAADIGGWREKRTLVLAKNDAGRTLLNTLNEANTVSIEECQIPFEKTVLPFMLREKRAKVDLRLEKMERRKTKWIGGYSPKLLASQKIEMAMTNHLEEKAICHKDDHSAHKMLRIGHRAYHEISSMFWLKVIYKLQYYSDNIIRNCMSQFDTIFNKFSIMKGRCFALQSSRRLKVGVIGLGNWGGQYLGFLTSSKYYELVVAYDSDVQHLNKLSKKYGILPAQNVEELCENYQVEAIFILTPTPTHYEVYQSVLKYGLPVYMEKPISQDLRSAQSMMNSSVKTDGMLYIAHSMKYEPVIQKIKILLENDTLGNIKSFEITRSVKYKNIDYYEEAALYQIGVHIIDIILFLFGEVESIISREHIDCNHRNYDHVHIRMCNGFDGKMHFGFSGVYNFHVRIIGSKATLTYADSKMTIYGDEEKMVTIEPMLHEKTVFKQLEEFFLAVRDQRKYLNTVENAMSIMKICSEITKEISHENRYDYASDS